MKLRSILGLALALAVTPALAQVSPGTSPLSIAKGGTAAATASAARTALGLAIGSAVEAWDNDLDCLAALATTGLVHRTGTGTCSAAIAGIADGGTGQITQAAAIIALLPTPTRAGDIIYWDGTNWNHLAGNNTGTQFLQETSAGVPSWVAAPGTGTVTSVICGTGLSGGTITTSGTCAVSLTTATNVIGADVLLNNTATFFDGPSMAQGTSGTWSVSGQVSLLDSAAASYICKLWDGTTVIASGTIGPLATNQRGTMALAGTIASPAANIRISCEDVSNTTGKITFNGSGLSKDSAIFGHRIQ